MNREDVLQILVESPAGVTAQAVRAEMRGRYGLAGAVKPALEGLISEGMASAAVDDDSGARLYVPTAMAFESIRSRDGMVLSDELDFFGH